MYNVVELKCVRVFTISKFGFIFILQDYHLDGASRLLPTAGYFSSTTATRKRPGWTRGQAGPHPCPASTTCPTASMKTTLVPCQKGGRKEFTLTAGYSSSITTPGRLRYILQALFLCASFLSKMEIFHLFSSSLPRFDKCHETSRIFPRTEQTFASARSFGVIS